jgi:hypothetical protein
VSEQQGTGREQSPTSQPPARRGELPPAHDAPPLRPRNAEAPPASTAPRSAPEQSPGGQVDYASVAGSEITAASANGRGAREAQRRSADRAADQSPRASGPADASAEDVKIGLWGSPSSGKTTFLGALRHAVATGRGSGRWIVHPDNEASEELMVRLTDYLVTAHEFPPATPLGVETELRWHFIGDLAGSQFDRRILRRRSPLPSRFMLNLVDVSGEAFGPMPEATDARSLHVMGNALDHLASSQGLIYLFDPISEWELHNSAAYLNRTIAALSRLMLRENRLVNGYLPHYVSVCVTKFDHPKIFDKARQALLVNAGPDGMPRILDEDAETLFNMVCDGKFWREDSEEAQTSARFIRDELRKRFHPDRVRYFVTSAVGFRQPPDWDPATGRGSALSIDPRNYANVYEVDGVPKIHGPITPINVLEPLISLHQRLTGTRKSRG